MTLTRVPGARTHLRFGILGPLSATLDGDDVGLGGRRQRAVIAVLLLARGHQVGSARLLDTLWDGEPPPSGPASLQAYVSHLRRALEPGRAARTPSTVLVGRGSGYALPVADDDVDAWRFERRVADAGTTGDPAVRLGL
ncbi:MAG: AfsR/SARP family transcriptional regulator, partial [Nocardioidaceae bacterium]